MIIVRNYRQEDAEGVAQVEESATALLRQIYRPNKKALSNRNAISPKMLRLVAESDGIIVGTAQFYIEKNALHVIGLGVHADFRRQGIARALVKEVVNRAEQIKLSSIVTNTVRETGNVAVFKALGFNVESECPDEYSESVTGNQLTDVELKINLYKN